MGINDAQAVDVSVVLWLWRLSWNHLQGAKQETAHGSAARLSMCCIFLIVVLTCICGLALACLNSTCHSIWQLLTPGIILCLQAHLGRFTALKTPISPEDWCSCFSRCPDLLSVSPEVLSERLSKLKALMIVDEEQAVLAVVKAPSLLQHAPQDIADKVCADYVRQLVHYTSGSARGTGQQ